MPKGNPYGNKGGPWMSTAKLRALFAAGLTYDEIAQANERSPACGRNATSNRGHATVTAIPDSDFCLTSRSARSMSMQVIALKRAPLLTSHTWRGHRLSTTRFSGTRRSGAICGPPGRLCIEYMFPLVRTGGDARVAVTI